MIDDDTYILKHNLAELLSTYDHRKPYYFGNANVFNGCDGIVKFYLPIGVKNMGDGPSFAHGGSGIVMSVAAVKAMIADIDRCIVKYRDCWAGDIRTALCLRDNGILIKGMQGFNNAPPHKVKAPACAKHYTFHHLLVNQIQQLWEIENSLNKKIISAADIFHILHGHSATKDYIVDTDMPGSDFENMKCDSAVICQTTCKNNPKCISYSYVDGVCWLKDSIVESKVRNGSVSGVLREKYVCHSHVFS